MMSKLYKVYGVGSAIMDYQCKINNEQDWPSDIKKGTTQLIDEETEALLYQKLKHLEFVKSCGGTGANTLDVIKKLGGRVYYSCKVANDLDGNDFHRDLQRNEIESNLDEINKPDGSTGKSLILVSSDADRSLCTLYGANSMITSSDLNEHTMSQSAYVFMEGFLATNHLAKPTVIAAMKMARNLGCRIAFTLSTSHIRLDDMVKDGVDLIFCNESEASQFAKTEQLNFIFEKLKAVAKTFVITRGIKDTIVYDGEKLYEIPAYPIKPVDTTGAGDVFAGAFLYGITSGFPFPKAADMANFAAAKIITKYGTRLDFNDVTNIAAHAYHAW